MAGNLGRAGSREERTLQALLLEKSRRKRISAILCPPYCGFMFEVPLVTSVVHDPDSIPLFAKIGVQALAGPQRIIAEHLFRAIEHPTIRSLILPEEERRALEDRRALVWSTSSGPLRPFFPIPGSKHRAFVRNLPSPQFPHDSQAAYSPIARNISTTSLQRTIVYATMNTSYGCVRSWPQERLSGRCRPAVRTYERLSRPSSVLNSSPKRNCSALTVGCFARRASMAFEPSPEWAKTTTRSSWILASAEALLCRFRYWLCWPGSTRCFPCRMTLPDSLSAFKALVTLTR